MIRKNKKFIDPRYFMDEKMEGGSLDQLEEWFGLSQKEKLKKAEKIIVTIKLECLMILISI